MCEDMVDASFCFGGLVEVNGEAAMMSEIDIEDAILVGLRADSDIAPMKCIGDLEFPVPKAEFAIPFDPYDLVIGTILDCRKDLRKGAWARTIAGNRCLQLQGLMGTLMVIDLTPALKGRLSMSQMLEALAIEDFGLERTMETFLLAIGLRVIGPAMTEADAQANQPQPQLGHLPGLARRSILVT